VEMSTVLGPRDLLRPHAGTRLLRATMELHMHSRHLAIALVVAASVAGCAAPVSLTRSGPPQPARSAKCEFQVFTAAPSGPFVEIGTLDVLYNDQKLSDFKKHIAPDVCAAGGDAVIAMANGLGFYIKATVLKIDDERATATTLTQASAPAAKAAGGCTFDTQCKGDRVCSKGECVEGRAAKRP
jgi:hypothetical protein